MKCDGNHLAPACGDPECWQGPDLIKRLRAMGRSGWHPIGNEAADEIESLRAICASRITTMELETVNKLFLELSQFATAKTARELALEKELDDFRHYKQFSDAEASCVECRIHYAKLAKDASSFFAWFNRHYPPPSSHHDHPWYQLGLALIKAEAIVEYFMDHKQ